MFNHQGLEIDILEFRKINSEIRGKGGGSKWAFGPWPKRGLAAHKEARGHGLATQTLAATPATPCHQLRPCAVRHLPLAKLLPPWSCAPRPPLADTLLLPLHRPCCLPCIVWLWCGGGCDEESQRRNQQEGEERRGGRKEEEERKVRAL